MQIAPCEFGRLNEAYACSAMLQKCFSTVSMEFNTLSLAALKAANRPANASSLVATI